jgi:Flp pilus assembly protein TadG
MAALRRLLRRARSESGAELIEFALVFPLLLLVVLGIADFGLMFQQYEVLTNAAREGARIAVLPTYSSADAITRVNQYVASGFLSTGGAVSTTVSAPAKVVIGANCMTVITVTVTYPHQYLFLGGIASYFNKSFGTKVLNAASTMRTEVAGGSCS